jgi:two-component system, NarL family, invasion response regulator UvrY
MLRIIIADDHTIVRRGLKEIIKEEYPSALVEEVEDGESLVSKVFKEQWDIVITDINMPGRSGLDALHEIKQVYPKLPVLVLSVYSEDLYGIRVLKAGAAGYLTKSAAPDELIKAIRAILLGKKYITPAIAEKLVSIMDTETDKPMHEYLSDREFEVFKLIAMGKSVSEIAASANLGVTTISTYRARILSKMNMRTNADLTLYAMENHII